MPHPMLPEPTPEPDPQPEQMTQWNFDFDPKKVGFTREQFMAQADDYIDKYLEAIDVEHPTTPVLANAILAVQVANWHELVAVFFATALQRLAAERAIRRIEL